MKQAIHRISVISPSSYIQDVNVTPSPSVRLPLMDRPIRARKKSSILEVQMLNPRISSPKDNSEKAVSIRAPSRRKTSRSRKREKQRRLSNSVYYRNTIGKKKIQLKQELRDISYSISQYKEKSENSIMTRIKKKMALRFQKKLGL